MDEFVSRIAGYLRETRAWIHLDEGRSGTNVFGAAGPGGDKPSEVFGEAASEAVRLRPPESQLAGCEPAQDNQSPAPPVMPEASSVDVGVPHGHAPTEDLIRWLENPDITIGVNLRSEVAARLRELSSPPRDSKENT